MKPRITAEELREVINYNPDIGEFRWKKRLSQGTQIGQIAGCLNKLGYWFIGIRRVRYYGHRLAWLYIHGEWPEAEIDHIDGNPANNRLSNLRPASRSDNMQNLVRIKKKSLSGLLGAHLQKNGKYSANVMLNYRRIHIGIYDTAQAAHEAYVLAKRKIHKGNTL